jgi:hypothetical protein
MSTKAPDPTLGTLARRNDRLMVAGVVAYAAFIVLLMVVGGVALTPDVIAVSFALVALLLGRGKLFFRDWIPFIALLLAYELMRGVADDAGLPLHTVDLAIAERLVMFGTIPSQVLQDALRPVSGIDSIALAATVVYMLHFALPLATGFVLWLWRRPHYYDFVAALILLSVAAFVTYLLLPAAPPWYLAWKGMLDGPDGLPIIAYLKPGAFEQIATALGFDGRYTYSFIFGTVNPNNTAAFPSLHVAYPVLTFLFLRRAFGRIGWIALGYAGLVTFSVLYTGDHWIIDAFAGAAYAYIAYYVIVHAPRRVAEWRVGRALSRAPASPTPSG